MSKLSNPRRHRAPLLEPLENRRLMSLTVDLRLPGGGKSANVSSVGQKVSLEVWATVNDANTSSTDDGLHSAQGSLLSSNVSGGAAKGTLDFTPLAPFNGLGSHDGTTQDLDGDGDSDVGSNDNSIDTNFVMARAGSLQRGDAFKLGTATFTVTSLLSTTGQTNLVFRGRNALAASVWLQDGKPARPGTDGSGYNDGTPVVIKRGTTTSTLSISGKVFNDTDGDGVLDTGETGRSNVRVYIDKDKDGVFDTGETSKLTDSSGNYSFTGLAAGSYRVRMVGISGYRVSTPSAGYYDQSSSASGKNFGVTQKVLISGRLWVDSDKDGVKDSTESVLSGWRVFIDKDKDGVFDSGEVSVLTDSSGNYSFKGLAAGSYRVRVVQQSGHTRISPTSGYYDKTLANGATSSNNNFRYTKP
jgi:uncharacterized protein (DUF2141 family)